MSQGVDRGMTATDVTGFDVISPLDFSLLSPDFRGLVLLDYTENLEKKRKIQWRASSGDGAPKLQISVPCRGRTCPEWKLGTEKVPQRTCVIGNREWGGSRKGVFK